MPELPEVEIVKQSLIKTIKNKRIIDVNVRKRNLRFKIDKQFENFLKENVVTNISRKAKHIILEIEKERYVLIHLGMSGTLHFVKGKSLLNTNLSFYNSRRLPENHNHVEIIFLNFKIIYNDPRRFGYIKIFSNRKSLIRFLDNYGLEPFDAQYSIDYLKKSLKNRKKNIKNILLDQKIISGIGNIYANEILFYSKVNPKKSGFKVKKEEISNIIKYSKIVLNLAIKFGGSSIRDFKNIEGYTGSFQNEFKIYGKEGENCSTKNCNGKIHKIFQTNRSTFFCKICQK